VYLLLKGTSLTKAIRPGYLDALSCIMRTRVDLKKRLAYRF